MLRLRLDALQDRAGRLYRDGEPFDGIAYEVRGDRVVANYRVTAGVRGGAAEVWDTARVRALGDALTLVSVDETDERFPEEGAYLGDVPFRGVAYAFDRGTGVLFAEQDYHPTAPGPSREWYRSGSPKAEIDRPRADGATESEHWHANGQSSGVSAVNWGYGLAEDGRLRTLHLGSDYAASDLARVPLLVDSFLYLEGAGVTDEVVARLRELNSVERLELSRTGISAGGLELFRACGKLQKIRTRKNPGFGEADVRRLLAHTPGCEWDGRLD